MGQTVRKFNYSRLSVENVFAGCNLLVISVTAMLNRIINFTARLLIRDPRIKERKKPGQKRARKKFAW